MFDVECMFHAAADSPLRDAVSALEALRPYADWLGSRDSSMKHWFLGGDTLEEAHLYKAFDAGTNGHEAVKAVLRNDYKNSTAPVVYLWNGEDNEHGASLVMSISEKVYPSKVRLALSGSPDTPRRPWEDYRVVAEFVAVLARTLRPECCSVYRGSAYFKHMVYTDRPGVGWMLYLPRALTSRDVPEAQAVLPVVEDGKQLGTILVSVADGVFSVRNPEHIKAARAIETRLVSQDWLPTWEQMIRSSP
jgi:hypothetical protein